MRNYAHLLPSLSDGTEFPHTAEIILAVKAAKAVDEPIQDHWAMIGSGKLILLSHVDPTVRPCIICLDLIGGIAYAPPSDGQ